MEYEVIYSKRTTLSISIKDGRVIVRSPYGVKREVIEDNLKSHISWIQKKLTEQEQRAEKYPEPTEEEIKLLRKKAKEILPLKTEYYSKIMGLKYGRITITSAKTRFGSCTSVGNISFSYRLMMYPESAIDYVVVHELAHLVEMNHSKRFYKIVESVFPDYKERRRLLKQ